MDGLQIQFLQKIHSSRKGWTLFDFGLWVSWPENNHPSFVASEQSLLCTNLTYQVTRQTIDYMTSLAVDL